MSKELKVITVIAAIAILGLFFSSSGIFIIIDTTYDPVNGLCFTIPNEPRLSMRERGPPESVGPSHMVV